MKPVPRKCAQPGCPNLTTRSYCGPHQDIRDRTRRLRETWRDYGSDWQARRARVLAEEPLCRLCGAPATEVDHIVPLRHGGTHDRANLRALCKPCHSRRTHADTLGD